MNDALDQICELLECGVFFRDIFVTVVDTFDTGNRMSNDALRCFGRNPGASHQCACSPAHILLHGPRPHRLATFPLAQGIDLAVQRGLTLTIPREWALAACRRKDVGALAPVPWLIAD